MSTTDTIASLGLIVSFFAFILSYKSYSIARKSLNISEQQHNERSLGMQLYYMDAYKWRKENEVFVSFALRFTNKSTLSNTISKTELHIEYHDKSNVIGKVKVQPDTLVTPVNLKKYADVINHPLCLAEKSAKSGWVTFKIPSYLKDQLTIDLYKVVSESIDNDKLVIETHIINEV